MSQRDAPRSRFLVDKEMQRDLSPPWSSLLACPDTISRSRVNQCVPVAGNKDLMIRFLAGFDRGTETAMATSTARRARGVHASILFPWRKR